MRTQYGYAVRTGPDEEPVPEIPPGGALWPSVTHWIDQGSVGSAALSFCINHLGYHMLALPDPNHRVWNAVKMATQKSKAFFWKTIAQLTLVFNLNYGPFGSSRWFSEKKRFFSSEWAAEVTEHDARFRLYAPAIAQDLGWPEPTTEADQRSILQRRAGNEELCAERPTSKDHEMV